MVTEARRKTKAKYDKKTKAVYMRLRTEQDADVLAKLESVPSKTEYIRMLVRRDINGA